MSKTKTKRARREQKREGHRKIAAHHRKAEKAPATATAAAATKTTTTPSSNPMHATTHPPSKKKQKPNKPASQPAPIQASQKHPVPFNTYDHILLVGEGDFSFTSSLVTDHGCANVTSTSYDSEVAVREKYPSFSRIEAELSALTPPVPLHHGIDATKLGSYKALRCQRSDDDEELEEGDEREGWDMIAFMFPHTGGLSTDVNRQVRANQALLVSFFKSCLDASTSAKRLRILQAQQAQKMQARRKGPLAPLPEQQEKEQRPFLRMGGRIIVTLFEGEPYTLWNIRDLARHSGLKVVESWKFDWSQYPAYGHVRTLGAIEGGGAWKGEDREARMYVFEKIPLVADSDEEKEMDKLSGKNKKKGGSLRREKKQDTVDKKRGRDESSDESD